MKIAKILKYLILSVLVIEIVIIANCLLFISGWSDPGFVLRIAFQHLRIIFYSILLFQIEIHFNKNNNK